MNKSREIPIEEAIDFLKPRLKEIDRVSEWSREMGYESSVIFSNTFRAHFHERPKKVMIRIKLEKAIELLSGSNDISCYEVVREIGKKDEHALYKFMMQHTDSPPSHFRKIKKDNGNRQ